MKIHRPILQLDSYISQNRFYCANIITQAYIIITDARRRNLLGITSSSFLKLIQNYKFSLCFTESLKNDNIQPGLFSITHTHTHMHTHTHTHTHTDNTHTHTNTHTRALKMKPQLCLFFSSFTCSARFNIQSEGVISQLWNIA